MTIFHTKAMQDNKFAISPDTPMGLSKAKTMPTVTTNLQPILQGLTQKTLAALEAVKTSYIKNTACTSRLPYILC
jgi:hypothetical protein